MVAPSLHAKKVGESFTKSVLSSQRQLLFKNKQEEATVFYQNNYLIHWSFMQHKKNIIYFF